MTSIISAPDNSSWYSSINCSIRALGPRRTGTAVPPFIKISAALRIRYWSPSGKKNKVKVSPDMNEENIEERIDITKQSSKRKSLGRGSSIKDGSKKTGYESPKEFRDAEKKFSEEFFSWVDNVIDEGYDISEYTLSEIVNIFDSQYE